MWRVLTDDLGGDIHQTNPGEELNLFDNDNIGLFYGYPYCWSEFDVPTYGLGPGTQWAMSEFMPGKTDEWCAPGEFRGAHASVIELDNDQASAI